MGADSREHGQTDPGEIARQSTVSVIESSVTTSQPRTELGQQRNVYDYIIDPENASGAFVINRKPPSEGHYLNQHIQPPVATLPQSGCSLVLLVLRVSCGVRFQDIRAGRRLSHPSTS